MARLIGIARHEASRAPMESLDEARISEAHGVAGDFRGSPGWRQVTVVAREAWDDACRDAGADLPWTTRRANLLVEGIDLARTTGRTLRVGEVVLAVTGESRPCERMDEAHRGLREAMTTGWRGGVCARVVQGGLVRVGDAVAWDETSGASPGE